MTPSPEEIEKALDFADVCSARSDKCAEDDALKTLAAAYRQLRDAQPRTWSAAPTTWEEYAARLAPLLPEWANFMAFDGSVFFTRGEPELREAGWNAGDGEEIDMFIRPAFIPEDGWRTSLLRISRTPEGVSVAAVTDGRGEG